MCQGGVGIRVCKYQGVQVSGCASIRVCKYQGVSVVGHQAYQHIVILTGAGISAESGIRTFRDSGGLWEDHSIEDVATPEGFRRNPALVYEFYNQRRAQLSAVAPNPAHMALGRLMAQHSTRTPGGTVTLITQNVDDLHERGGADTVLHMHGELLKARCTACNSVSTISEDFQGDTPCPVCGETRLRPDIVWFGEMPYFMDTIADALTRADLFVSIGTSGNVYPAAGFVQEIRMRGRAHSIEINLEPSEGASVFAECRHGKASDLVPRFVAEILGD